MGALYGVTRAGYYAWRRRGESARRRQDRGLLVRIRALFDGSLGTYGSPRIHRALAAAASESAAGVSHGSCARPDCAPGREALSAHPLLPAHRRPEPRRHERRPSDAHRAESRRAQSPPAAGARLSQRSASSSGATSRTTTACGCTPESVIARRWT